MTEQPFDKKSFLASLTERPGVYRMHAEDDTILYVGKARNLKKRVSSYFRNSGLAPKTQALMQQMRTITVTVTHTESEALILENNLIKEFRPRYNILLRDDKSYPYICLSTEQDFPRLGFHRGGRRGKGRYFGPYPSAGAVRETLSLLQKLFPIRQCEDSFYRNRSRPCLQYQIKRCSAPCVGFIDKADYAEDVRNTILFLEGRDDAVIDSLVQRMETAAGHLDYERAATYRDQIARLRSLSEKQYVSSEGGDLDIIACSSASGSSCVQVFTVRGGHHLGNRAYFPKHIAGSEDAEILAAFITQYYLGEGQGGGARRPIPSQILVNHAIDDSDWLQGVLTEQAGHKVSIHARVRGERARWLEMATDNAHHALQQQLSSKSSLTARFEALQDALGLEAVPQRMECFDISHTMGEATVASCVVFDSEGPNKSNYRRYNIEGITPGDDYAAMRQALLRRYSKVKEGEGAMPDVLFIDGGKGQLRQAGEVLQELQIGGITVVGIAKGPERKPGEEDLFLLGHKTPFILPADSKALHLIQQIRDEAHRFAITGHRQRRAKARQRSVLEDIKGLGPKRRQRLLKQFGGLQGVNRAGKEDLARVEGISLALAERIYDVLHGDSH
ncbi:excinuclease ABC subunit UvrC [Sulfuriflexus mobilis]|uniref:excinuclease ABC subunit UvrC n=1 Tax=Sulfuriflexus mobilis TaxID=1811807 RepID=UPI000F82AE6F|nr:excinuclease ABC subunit UvrC [Sulfuriflexus mobilis]